MKTILLVDADPMAGSPTHLAQTAVIPPASDLDGLMFAGQSLPRRMESHHAALMCGLLHDNLAAMPFVSTDGRILCVTRSMEIDQSARTSPPKLRGPVAFLAIDTVSAICDPHRLRRFGEDPLGPDAQARILTSGAEATKALSAAQVHRPRRRRQPCLKKLMQRQRSGAHSHERSECVGARDDRASALPEPPPTVMLFDRSGQIAMTYGGDPLDTFTQGLRPTSTGASDSSRAPL